MKLKNILSIALSLFLIISTFSITNTKAEDVPYLDIYNSQGVYGIGDNAIAISGTRKEYNGDPIMGNYSTLTGSFVHICEGSNAIAQKWVDNIEKGRLTVFEVDFKPDANTKYVSMYTYYTKKMTYAVDLTTLGDVVKVGEWNHLKLIADTSIYNKDNNVICSISNVDKWSTGISL